MKQLTFEDIMAMKGNGSSMRYVLKHFTDKGATVYLLHEEIGQTTNRYFVVDYENIKIPLRSNMLNFYSIHNSLLAQTITSNKQRSHAVLTAWSVPTPKTVMYDDSLDTDLLFEPGQFYVVKPIGGAHGEGISLGVADKNALTRAITYAQAIQPEVLIQQQVNGDDHRLLFIDYEFVAAVKRVPATIVGDGVHTVREIVEEYNAQIAELWMQIRSGSIDADSTKGSTSKTPISEIVEARGEDFLDRVPADGESLRVLDKANVSLGGQTYDVTDGVNPKLVAQISKMLKDIGLPVCGVDVMSTDISSSPEDGKSYVIELNAAPGLRLHEMPYEGQPRPVCAMMAESLIKYYKEMTLIDRG